MILNTVTKWRIRVQLEMDDLIRRLPWSEVAPIEFLTNIETITSRWRAVATSTDLPCLGGRARIYGQNYSESVLASPLQQVQL